MLHRGRDIEELDIVLRRLQDGNRSVEGGDRNGAARTSPDYRGASTRVVYSPDESVEMQNMVANKTLYVRKRNTN